MREYSIFLSLPDVLLLRGSRSDAPSNNYHMKLHIFFDIVCERLVDELVKEMLKDRYTIVSACYKEKDGKKIRKRKAHVRRRR